MLKNYFITAIRNLYRNRVFSLINILGLSIGLASFILISLYVFHEFSFDKYHTKADRIYRIVENLRTENELLLQSTSSPPMGPTMQRDFPEVEAYVRFLGTRPLVKKDGVKTYEEECFFADSSVFKVFTYPLISGNSETALVEPQSVVVTESTAKKYFGNEDALGQTLNLDNEEFKITGVMEDVPENSHFRFDMLLSFSSWSEKNKENEMRQWFWNRFHTYILLKDEQSIASLRSKMPEFITRNIEKGGMYYEDLPLQPLKSIYLDTPRSWENGKRGSESNIYILSVIALFILLIACFNYVNLATARATRRLKEVALRKVLGAERSMLVLQFIGESIMVSALATTVGFGLSLTMIPIFNTMIGTSLSIDLLPGPLFIVAALAGLMFLLGLLSGFYPALVISGFEPLQVFRDKLSGIFSHQNFRKALVTIQFVISICLVAGTILVYDQLSLMRNADLGFKKEATLILRYNYDENVRNHLDAVKDKLKNIEGISTVTASHTVPGESTTNLYTQIEIEDGKMSPTNINTNLIDHDYLDSYKIELLAGRSFDRSNAADDTTAFLINETAMRDFGWTEADAIGKKINQGRDGKVIGVVKDFHYQSLHHRVEPLLLYINKYAFNKLSIKIESKNIPAVLTKVEAFWKTQFPDLPLLHSFLEDDYEKLYQADQQLGKVAATFSGLAILVGCLGLLGLTSFSVERRVKEIGIRKVLGASVINVILLVSKEFFQLIILAIVIAIPLTYYLIDTWLENFTNRINISAVSFMLAGLSVLVVAGATMSFLAFRAGAMNPSKALRNE